MLVKAKVSQSSFSAATSLARLHFLPQPQPQHRHQLGTKFQLPEAMGDILTLTTTNGEASRSFGSDWLTTADSEGHWHTAQEM